MEKKDIEELKRRVPCAAVLETAGFAIDPKESTRKAVKYRRANDIIIVIHDGKGWFDALSDDKGDVFSLVSHLERVPFAEVLQRVSDLVGFKPTEPVWTRSARPRNPDFCIADRWHARRKPRQGSPTWRYLRDERKIPDSIIRAAVAEDQLREGPHGSMWAAHLNDEGGVTGWEERGSQWRGFSTGGAKVLFRLGVINADRVCVTEAAIDAMSLAAMEGLRPDSLYLSTGGGWAPATVVAIQQLAARRDKQLVAATDNNKQGDVYAGRLEAIASEVGCAFERLRPSADDWNDGLRTQLELGEDHLG
jgi:hypothetical protein